MKKTESKVLLFDAIEAALQASKDVMEVYENTIEVEYKEDNSPLTIADKKAHERISEKLKPTGIPILSEEGRNIPYSERSAWPQLWVVDPLDGTKEFVKQNGEFTVNIALVEDTAPIAGVIYVPVKEVMYFAAKGTGAYLVRNLTLDNLPQSMDELMEQAIPLPENPSRPFTMVGSRSHMSEETARYFEEIRKEHPGAEILSRGSSLKICMVAEGSADVYPRFAPTMEWDTAAGHAIVKECGYDIYHTDRNEPLEYNKEDLVNPWFIVKKAEK